MGYELHIFRKSDWENDEEPSNISLAEWKQYVNSDPELEFDKQAVAGEYGEGFCIWNAHPTKKSQSDRPWFAFFRGSIDAKYPDEHTIRKMLQIAEKLNSRVQGDDLEFYDEHMIAEVFGQPSVADQENAVSPKPWWRFW